MTPLPNRWLALIYGALLVPGGALLLAVGSSVAYYRLRRRAPALARAVNRHAWLAIALNVCANVVVMVSLHR